MNGLGYDGMARKSRRGTQKTRTSALPAEEFIDAAGEPSGDCRTA
jgi:hypothetical protein